RVPAAVGDQRAKGVGIGPVGMQGQGAGRRWPAEATGQGRHLVTTGKCRLHDSPPDVVGAAEYKKSHPASVHRPAPIGSIGSFTAERPVDGPAAWKPLPGARIRTGARPRG